MDHDQTDISIEQIIYVSHLMMKRNSLIRRGFISGVNPANNFGSNGTATKIGSFRESKSFNNIVEVRRSLNMKSSKVNNTIFF